MMDGAFAGSPLVMPAHRAGGAFGRLLGGDDP
jgi:hypothetical protein